MPGLKKILNWSLKQTGEHAQDVAPAKPMSDEDRAWLNEAMSAVCLNETQRLKDLVEIVEYSLSDEAPTTPATAVSESEETIADLLPTLKPEELLKLKVSSLEELAERLEQIDNAKFFALNHGGSGKLPLLLELMRSAEDEIRWRAAALFATVCQNNGEVQAKAMELGAMRSVMVLAAAAGTSAQCQVKAFSALSCLLRSADAAEESAKAFLSAGGLALLRGALAAPGEQGARLRRKASFFVQYLCSAVPEARAAIAADDVLVSLVVATAGDDDVIARDTALQALGALCVSREGAAAFAAGSATFRPALEAARARLEAVPEDEKEYVEDLRKLCVELLRVSADGKPVAAIDGVASGTEPTGGNVPMAAETTRTAPAVAALSDRAAVPEELRDAARRAVEGLLAGRGDGGAYTVSVPTSAAGSLGQTYGPQIAAWRRDKTLQWERNDVDCKLRVRGIDTRERLEAWMDRQCEKALQKKALERDSAAAARVGNARSSVTSAPNFHLPTGAP